MFKRQIKNIDRTELKTFFLQPATARQRQYEAIRAVVVDQLELAEAADKFGYKVNSLYSLIKAAKVDNASLFPIVSRKEKTRKITADLNRQLIRLRNCGLGAKEICQELKDSGVDVSVRSVERALTELGFPKLKRRTNKELGITRKNTVIPSIAQNIDFAQLEPFSVDCPSAGVFQFIPYILESGIIEVLERCDLPESSVIGAKQACLSMLLMKLLGQERLSHIKRYDAEVGFGIFAGLTVPPKATYMNTYSCLCSEEDMLEFQRKLVSKLNQTYPQIYTGATINLDFHSIPHFGDESEMEKVWCGARGKAMKGANTVFAQDGASNAIMYTRADILRCDEAKEVMNFVDYWKEVNGNVEQTLVFDCKFTTYAVLGDLAQAGIKFITLRKRNAALVKETIERKKEDWQSLYLPIPKRKRKRVKVFEQTVVLKGCKTPVRQITIKDHGRANPTYIVTNDLQRSMKEVLIIYAKRWHVEQKLAEMVSFFNLNALSSPLMIRIHFDVLWTLVADTLYHILADDLKRFEDCLAPTIFKKFIDIPGRVIYDGIKFQVRIRKRAHTPVLLGVQKLCDVVKVPWLNNRKIEVVWTP